MKWRIIAALVLGLFFSILWVKSIVDNNKKLTTKNKELTTLIQQANQLINQHNKSIQQLNSLDKKYSEKLRNAEIENDALRERIESGAVQLHVNATCPENNNDTRSTRTPSMDNATTAGLTNTAATNYILLRKRIKKAEEQVKSLQEYVTLYYNDARQCRIELSKTRGRLEARN